MASKQMAEALNKQLNAELYSAYLYWSMAAYFEAESFAGFAHWMEIQAQEEMGHAVKFYRYAVSSGSCVEFEAIAKPEAKFASPLAVFEATLKHEKYVTSCIHNLVELARGEKDYATEMFLQWFVTEQVEEEANASKLVHDLNMVKDAPGGMFMMDRQLGQRQASASSSSE